MGGAKSKSVMSTHMSPMPHAKSRAAGGLAQLDRQGEIEYITSAMTGLSAAKGISPL